MILRPCRAAVEWECIRRNSKYEMPKFETNLKFEIRNKKDPGFVQGLLFWREFAMMKSILNINFIRMEDKKPSATKEIDDNKVIAAIGYLGILCLIPLLAKKDSAFAMHHGKNGLVLLIAWLILWVGNIIPVLGQIIWVLGSLVLLVMVIIGISRALAGEKWDMPVLGQYTDKIKL